MTALPLPVLSCDDCGRCCLRVGTPPSFFPAYALPSVLDADLTGHEDYQTWLAMPEALRDKLRAFYASQDGLSPSEARCDSGLPCIWYDIAAKRCGHYEFRPQACREFEVGGEDCLRIREEVPHYGE